MNKEMQDYVDGHSLSIWDILIVTFIVAMIGGCVGSYIYLFKVM